MFTQRAVFTAFHGVCFGGLALLTLFGLVVSVWTVVMNAPNSAEQMKRTAPFAEKIYLMAMVLFAWAAVLSGTFLIYPWYRAKPPAGVGDLRAFPRALLLANAANAPWHTVGMEWKEHVAFLAPVTVTAVAFIWWRYREHLLRDRRLFGAVLAFGLIGLGAIGTAAFLGALLNKLAPVY